MADKADVTLDIAALESVDVGVLSALKVGQRLVLSTASEPGALPSVCTEAGVQLAPLPDPHLADRFYDAKVMVKSIRREAGSGAIQQLQVRLSCAAGGGGAGPGPGSAHGAGASGASGAAAGPQGGGADGSGEPEYSLRQSQYLALAESGALQGMLADPRLQGLLAQIDAAPDRERALAVQLNNPELQGFVSQVLTCLDPDRVSATAAAVEAAATGP